MSNTVIATNVLALNSHRNLSLVGTQQAKSSARLSSGYKINSAADDAAGLAISEKMRSQIRGLDMASKNTQDATSLIQTAEGGMQEIDNMLQRVRELVNQASNDTNDNPSGDRQKIQDEINAYVKEIDKMTERTEFNKKKLLNGDALGSVERSEMVQNVQTQLKGLIGTQAAVAAATDATDGKIGSLYAKGAASLAEQGVAQTALMESVHVSVNGGAHDALSSHSIASTMGFVGGGAAISVTLNKSDWDLISDVTTAGVTSTSSIETTGTLVQINSVAAFTGDISNSADVKTQVDKIVGYIEKVNLSDMTDAQKKGIIDNANSQIDALKEAKSLSLEAEGLIDSKAGLQANTQGDGLYLQVGANADQGFTISIANVNSKILGIGNGNGEASIDVKKATGEDITGLLNVLDNALSFVTTERSKLGAYQNRLEYAQKSLDISSENLSAAESRIRDADMAKEMMGLTKSNVLQQAATSMLAQANQAPQNVLQLLQ